MIPELIKNGDTGLFAGTSFLSKEIIRFMTQYRNEFPVDKEVVAKLKGFVPSHAGTFFRVDGVLYLFGSIEWGFKPIVFLDHYSDADSFMVFRDGLTLDQSHRALKKAMVMTGESTLYPYWSIALWILYIKTHWKWLLSFGGRRAEVCYESTYEIKREVLPEKYNLNPNWVSCFDLIRPDSQLIIDNRK